MLTVPGPRAAARFHYLSLLLAYPALLWLGRDTWFRLDEWHIVLGHQAISRPWDILAPFDIHWATVPVLYYHAVGAFAGAGAYLPYLGVAVAVYVVDAHLLWRVLRRCGVESWIASLSAAALLVLGAGWESMYWVLIVGYTAPLAFTFGAVLIAGRDELRRRDRAAIAALTVLAAMSSGAGVAMVIVPAVMLALRRGVIEGLLGLAPAALVYLVWLDLAGSTILNHPGGASREMAGTVARFVWDGMTGSVATLVGPPLLGAAGLVVLAGWMAARWRRRGMPAAVPACAAGAVAMFVLTAVGRANGGVATAPHYVATGAALLLPAAALAATDLRGMLRRLRIARAAVFAGLLVVVGHGAADLVANTASATRDDQESRRVLLAAALLSEDGTALPDSYVENHLAWAVSIADIERMRARGELQAPKSVPADLASEVRLRMHVALSTTPVVSLSAPVVTGAHGATLTADGSCTRATSTGSDPFDVAVRFVTAGALRVEAESPVGVEAFLHGGVADPGDPTRLLTLLPPLDVRYLDDVQPGTAVILRISPGSVRLCG